MKSTTLLRESPLILQTLLYYQLLGVLHFFLSESMGVCFCVTIIKFWRVIRLRVLSSSQFWKFKGSHVVMVFCEHLKSIEPHIVDNVLINVLICFVLI